MQKDRVHPASRVKVADRIPAEEHHIQIALQSFNVVSALLIFDSSISRPVYKFGKLWRMVAKYAVQSLHISRLLPLAESSPSRKSRGIAI